MEHTRISILVTVTFFFIQGGETAYCMTGGISSTDPALYPCLHVSNGKFTWHDALDMCEQEGGTLVKIESQAQQDYIEDNQGNNAFTWFGMNDIDVENTFVWTDGLPVTWFNWRGPGSQQPNGGDSQNCGAIWYNSYDWEDKDCTELRYFVCQFSLSGPLVENLFKADSFHLTHKEAQLQKPDTFNGIELMSRLVTEDESLCVLHCLYNPLCTTMAYGPLKSPYNCLLYKAYAQGYAPLWKGWNMYAVTHDEISSLLPL